MKSLYFGALTALGICASQAHAAPFTLSYQTAGDPFGDGALYSAIQIDSPVYDGTFNAGQFELSIDGIEDIMAFCIEVTQGLRDGSTYEDTPNLFDNAVVANIDRLFTSAYDTVTSGIAAAAFQVALWEIVEDTATGLDLTSGAFLTPANSDSNQQQVRDTAQSYLDGLATAETGGFALRFLAGPDSQDVVTFERLPTPSQVPLPVSGLLLLSGLAVLARGRVTS